MALFKKIGGCAVFSILCVLILQGVIFGGVLYRYQDENGIECYTDDPSDPRYRYQAITTYPDSIKEETKKDGEELKPSEQNPEVQKKASKRVLSPEEAADKDRMLKKIVELEEVKKKETFERNLKMLDESIDLLKKQLKELDEPRSK